MQGKKGRPLGNFDIEQLKQMKMAGTTAARLYNWNILIKEIQVGPSKNTLQELGIEVDPDTKSLIVNGDTELLNELLLKMIDLEHSIVPSSAKANREDNETVCKSHIQPLSGEPLEERKRSWSKEAKG